MNHKEVMERHAALLAKTPSIEIIAAVAQQFIECKITDDPEIKACLLHHIVLADKELERRKATAHRFDAEMAQPILNEIEHALDHISFHTKAVIALLAPEVTH